MTPFSPLGSVRGPFSATVLSTPPDPQRVTVPVRTLRWRLVSLLVVSLCVGLLTLALIGVGSLETPTVALSSVMAFLSAGGHALLQTFQAGHILAGLRPFGCSVAAVPVGPWHW